MAAFCSNDRLIVGGWEKERKLGQGQFGCVTLWRNTTTKEYIVIKQCITELAPKNKQRWRDEIACLHNLKHENLVSTRETPDAILIYFTGPEPCLGLEYCEGGDLRKVLNYEDNCVGLREKTVLAILHDVSNGIAFLHQHKIIHRDIKPENILISYIGNKVIYKITDLGYAKQLDQTSLCTSFVGTLNYIAPELYSSDAYNTEVDYWSFGTMMFECITGRRPFEIHGQLLQWYKLIANKENDDIWGEVSERGERVVFHKSLAEPNRLSRPIADMFVNWLGLVLRWKPSERLGVRDSYGVREGIRMIDDILATQVVRVFCISTGVTNSYSTKSITRVDRLQSLIDKDCDVSVQDQELLLPTGTLLKSEDTLESHAKEMENTEQLIFLINRRSLSSVAPLVPPETVQVMLGSSDTPMAYDACKLCWGHSLYFSITAAQRYKRMLQGVRAVLIKLNRANAILAQKKDEIIAAEQQFEAYHDMLVRSLEFDREQFHRYDLQERRNTSWLRQELGDLLDKVQQFTRVNTADFKERVRQEQTRFITIRKHPLCAQSESELDRIAVNVRNLYRELKGLDIEKRTLLRTSEDVAAKVLEVIETSDALDKRLSQHFRNTWACLNSIDSLTCHICSGIEDIVQGQRQILEWYEYKQAMIWRLVSHSASYSRLSSTSGCSSTTSSIANILDHSMQSIPEGTPSEFEEALDRQQSRLKQKIEQVKLVTTSNDTNEERRGTKEQIRASSLDNFRYPRPVVSNDRGPHNNLMKSM